MITTLIMLLALGVMLYICIDILSDLRVGTTIANWIGCACNLHSIEDADHPYGSQSGRHTCRRCGKVFDV